ncbi:MAG TPA: hypothetical protein GX529_03455 [Firmicutes bacterium]|nr:hypothetical protein [Candidatus Fermentithermobacillaceae bacterium]
MIWVETLSYETFETLGPSDRHRRLFETFGETFRPVGPSPVFQGAVHDASFEAFRTIPNVSLPFSRLN